MHHLVREGGSPQEWDDILTPLIMGGFRRELSQSELKLIDELEAIPSHLAGQYVTLVQKLDAFILHVARSLGWRIMLSTLVHQRMAGWQAQDPHGPEKFEKLGKTIAHAARVLQRQRAVPVTDRGWRKFKKQTVPDLRLMFQRLADIIRTRPSIITTAELLELVSKLLDEHPEGFGLLRRNLDSLREYLSRCPDSSVPLRAGEKISPSGFFDKWWAWQTQHDPEQFRQSVSRTKGRTENSNC